MPGGNYAGQAAILQAPLRQASGVREQCIVIAVLPPVLEPTYARAAEGLLAGGLVGVIERLVLEELKPILPANESGLVWVLT